MGIIFALVYTRQAAVALLHSIMGQVTFSMSEVIDVGAGDTAHSNVSTILAASKEYIWAAQKDVGNTIILAYPCWNCVGAAWPPLGQDVSLDL